MILSNEPPLISLSQNCSNFSFPFFAAKHTNLHASLDTVDLKSLSYRRVRVESVLEGTELMILMGCYSHSRIRYALLCSRNLPVQISGDIVLTL